MAVMSERTFWTLIQKELGCEGCKWREKGMEGVGVPCQFYPYMEDEEELGCEKREVELVKEK